MNEDLHRIETWLSDSIDAASPPTRLVPTVRARVRETPQDRAWIPSFDGTWARRARDLALVGIAAVVVFAIAIPAFGLLADPSQDRADGLAAASVRPTAEVADPEYVASDPLLETIAFIDGVTLTAEAVAPGVHRIIDDGFRDLSKTRPPRDAQSDARSSRAIVAGDDGSVWVFGPDESIRLGGDRSAPAPTWEIADQFMVSRDGTAFAIHRSPETTRRTGETRYMVLYRGGQTPATELGVWSDYAGLKADAIALSSDGRLWSARPMTGRRPCEELAAGPSPCGTTVGSIAEGGVEDRPMIDIAAGSGLSYIGVAGVWATDEGAAWLLDAVERHSETVYRLFYVNGGVAERVDLPSEIQGEVDAAMSRAGFLWITYEGGLAGFDGSSWELYSDDEAPRTPSSSSTGRLIDVGADGAVWLAERDSTTSCSGVTRFDGSASDRVLDTVCPTSLDIADDGSVWLMGSTGGSSVVETYRIDPTAFDPTAAGS